MPTHDWRPLLTAVVLLAALLLLVVLFLVRRRRGGSERGAGGDAKRFLVQVRAGAPEVARLRREWHLDMGCLPPPVPLPDGTMVIQAIVDAPTRRALTAAGAEVKVLADLEREAERLRPYLARGDRFEDDAYHWPVVGRFGDR
jgi:hypothetical protein